MTNGSDPQTGKNYARCQEPLDPSWCDDIKKNGVKIAVLYTTYLPLPTNAWYNSWIAPFAERHRDQHAVLRVARPLLRGRTQPGHLGSDDRPVPEGGREARLTR